MLIGASSVLTPAETSAICPFDLGAGVPPGAVVTRLGTTPIDDLDGMEAALAAVPDGVRVPIRYFTLRRPRTARVSIFEASRRWSVAERCVRDDSAGRFRCRPLAPAPEALPPEG